MRFLLLCLIALSAFSPVLASSAAAPLKNLKLSDDFFLTLLPKGVALPALQESTSCRDQMHQALCVVESAYINGAATGEACDSDSTQYTAYFDALFDLYPPRLQQLFCSVRKIYVETSNQGSLAYASPILNADGITQGAILGVRKSILEGSISLAQILSWKEQLSFGGFLNTTNGFTIREDLPSFRTFHPTVKDDLLFYVFAHEFGHLLDFANELNRFEAGGGVRNLSARVASNSWGDLSWILGNAAKPESGFLDRSRFCFYWCNGNFTPKDEIADLYEDLYLSQFLTAYSTQNVYEDFAETFAFHIFHTEPRTTIYLDTKQGQVFDLSSKLNSLVMDRKLGFIRNFLGREKIRYP